MKRTTILVMGLGCLCVSTAWAQDEARFNKGEWDVSPYATYVDKVGGKWGAGAALTYFVTDKIGVGASTYWTDGGGTFFDNAAGEAYFRLPIGKAIAPYAVGSVGYQFDYAYWVETFGAGIDFRPFKNLSAFSDLQWRIADQSTRNGAFLRLGARFSF
jgi:hypothetical protein